MDVHYHEQQYPQQPPPPPPQQQQQQQWLQPPPAPPPVAAQQQQQPSSAADSAAASYHYFHQTDPHVPRSSNLSLNLSALSVASATSSPHPSSSTMSPTASPAAQYPFQQHQDWYDHQPAYIPRRGSAPIPSLRKKRSTGSALTVSIQESSFEDDPAPMELYDDADMSYPDGSPIEGSASSTDDPKHLMDSQSDNPSFSVIGKSSAPNNFVAKLYHMINDHKSAHFITWTDLGTSFVVSNVGEFSRSILGAHFKHNNFSSFVRQLNMYGFHKINRTPRAQRTSTDAQTWEFSHHKFLRGRPDLLEEIKRKALDPDPGGVRQRVELPAELAMQLGKMEVGLNRTMEEQRKSDMRVGGMGEEWRRLGDEWRKVEGEHRGLVKALITEREKVGRLTGIVKVLYDVVATNWAVPIPFPQDLLESTDNPSIFISSPPPTSYSTSHGYFSVHSPNSSPTSPDFQPPTPSSSASFPQHSPSAAFPQPPPSATSFSQPTSSSGVFPPPTPPLSSYQPPPPPPPLSSSSASSSSSQHYQSSPSSTRAQTPSTSSTTTLPQRHPLHHRLSFDQVMGSSSPRLSGNSTSTSSSSVTRTTRGSMSNSGSTPRTNSTPHLLGSSTPHLNSHPHLRFDSSSGSSTPLPPSPTASMQLPADPDGRPSSKRQRTNPSPTLIDVQPRKMISRARSDSAPHGMALGGHVSGSASAAMGGGVDMGHLTNAGGGINLSHAAGVASNGMRPRSGSVMGVPTSAGGMVGDGGMFRGMVPIKDELRLGR